MDRRRILLVAAVLVAAMGAVLVFLYVQGADSRAEERFDTVDVLKATAIIEPGESIEDASAAGKLTLAAVAQDQLLNGYQTDTDDDRGHQGDADDLPRRADRRGQVRHRRRRELGTADPGRQDRDLGEPHRPVPRGRLRQPGFRGGDLRDAAPTMRGRARYSRMLCSARVTVLGVGNTTPVSTTTTDETGASTTEQLPRTLLTISVEQNADGEGALRAGQRRAGVRSADRGQRRGSRRGR